MCTVRHFLGQGRLYFQILRIKFVVLIKLVFKKIKGRFRKLRFRESIAFLSEKKNLYIVLKIYSFSEKRKKTLLYPFPTYTIVL